MKKIIMITLLAGSFSASDIDAMAQEMLQLKAKAQKSDKEPNKQFELEKDHALLSETINDAYKYLADQEGKLKEAIPLGNVTQGEVEFLLNGKNYDYILRVHRAYNQGADADPVVVRGLSDEERKRRAEIEASALDPVIFSANSLKEAWSYLQAAHYLNIPELIEKYARILKSMLCSDASMGLLQANNQEHIKMIGEINKNRTLTDFILHYIPKIWAAWHTLTGHTGWVLSTSFSPDDSKIVTASYDGTAKIWNAGTGALEHTLAGHTDRILSASFSPDGSKIVTASYDGTAKIWNAQTGVLGHTLVGHTNLVISASFSPYGSKIVTGSKDASAKIWNAQTGVLEHTLVGHTSLVISASFSPDGSKIVTASSDKTAKIWNVQTGALEHTLEGHANVVDTALFSPDGSKIVTASWDKTAKIWNVQTGALERTLEGHIDWVRSASFSPDGSKIVTASSDGTAKIWNVQTGALEHTLEGHAYIVDTALFSPDGSKIVTRSGDGTAKIWNARTGALEHTLAGHTGKVTSASFSQDGNKIVTASDDGTVKIWGLLPAHTIEQALFLQYLQFIKNQDGQPGWVSGWGRAIMDTFEPDEKAFIKKAFPRTMMQKIGSYFGFGSSSSSNSNNNN